MGTRTIRGIVLFALCYKVLFRLFESSVSSWGNHLEGDRQCGACMTTIFTLFTREGELSHWLPKHPAAARSSEGFLDTVPPQFLNSKPRICHMGSPSPWTSLWSYTFSLNKALNSVNRALGGRWNSWRAD